MKATWDWERGINEHVKCGDDTLAHIRPPSNRLLSQHSTKSRNSLRGQMARLIIARTNGA